MERKREEWLDAARGFAIYLVVLGHCIQYATPHGYDFKANLIFELIYGFHMALFMLLSGYLFWNTLSRYSLIDGVKAKLKGILVPCAAWGLVTYICDILVFHYKDISITGYLHYTVYSNWFLWAVLYCSIYGFITKFVFRNHVIGYAVVLVINYLLPEFGNYAGTKRMLPFFILGILACRYELLKKIDNKSKMILFFLSGILYLVTLKLGMLELITGTLGSICVILFFCMITQKYRMIILQEFGKVSICIYLLTGILFFFLIKESCRISDDYRYLIKASYVLGLSVVLTVLSWGVGKLLLKNKVLSKLFMGR